MLKPEMKQFCLCDEVVQLFVKLHDSAALDPANWVLYLHVKVWLHNAALFLALCKLFLVESIVKLLLKADKDVISRNNGAVVSQLQKWCFI